MIADGNLAPDFEDSAVPLAEVASEQTNLLSYAGPVTGDVVTIGFRQGIGAGDVLRAGTYNKTLTFSLSATTP